MFHEIICYACDVRSCDMYRLQHAEKLTDIQHSLLQHTAIKRRSVIKD